MGERAREFLDRWESENVKAIPETRKLQEIARLALTCRQDAVRVGITAEELRTAANGDLIRDIWASAATKKTAQAAKCGRSKAGLWRRILDRLQSDLIPKRNR